MEKKKKAKSRQTQPKEPPKDLSDKVNTLKVMTVLAEVLSNGLFQTPLHSKVSSLLEWTGNMHQTILKQALSHPDAKLVPELVALMKTSKEAANGAQAS